MRSKEGGIMKKSLNYKKRSSGERIVFVAVFAIFTIYALCLLYPFLFCFNASLMNGARTFLKNSVAIPCPPKFDNYAEAFLQLNIGAGTNTSSFFDMLFNSVWYSVGGAFLSVIFTSMTTYVVCKYKFFGSKFIYTLIIILMMIPVYGSMPAQYRLYSNLGMTESPLILLSFCSGRGNFLIIYAFYKVIPWSYAEAAFIDGASDSKVFWTIMFPMALPSISAIFIMEFVGCWNDYYTPILYLNRYYPTLASGLYEYEMLMAYKANHPVYFAGVLISLIPVLILFFIFQNTIMEKVYIGGLKG